MSDANGVSSVQIYDGATLLGPATVSSGNWSYTTAALPDGSHSFTAKATDTAGNTTTTSAVTATVDTTPPTETISTTINTDTGVTTTITSGGVTKDNTLGLSGTVSDAGGVSSVQIYDGATLLGPATVSSGNWSYTTAALPDGSHSFTAKATDTAGNTTTTSAVTATINTGQVDTTPPTETISTTINTNTGATATITSGGVTKDTTLGLSGTVSDAGGVSSVQIYDGATLLGSAKVSSGNWSYTTAALPNGSHSFTAKATDTAGNTTTTPAVTATVDTKAPTISSVVANPATANLDAGNTVALTVNFSENVMVAGTPFLTLNDGGTAAYAGGGGTSALTFNYLVAAGDNTSDLRVTGLTLNGATITDGALNNAVLTGAVKNPTGVLKIDTTAPTVTKVLSSVASGRVNTGGTVRITIDTSEAVSVNGSPTLLLNDGGTASYDAAHSTTTALAFNYTVAAGQVTTDLVVSGIQLPSTTSIEDLAGNNANLSGAGANLGLQINTASKGQAGPSGGNFAINGSTELELFGPSTANVTLASGSTGMLRLDTSSQFAGTVAGLAPGNYLDLADQSYQGNSAPTYNSTGANTGTLTVTEGASTINVALLGSYLANSFVASGDGHGGTLISDPSSTTQVLLTQSQHA